MAEVKLTLSRKTFSALIQLGSGILSKQAPEPPEEGGPAPAPLVPGVEAETDELKLAHEELKEAKLDYDKLKASLDSLRKRRNAKADAFRKQLGGYVNLVSGKVAGDEITLRALGLEIARTGVRSGEPPSRVVNLRLTQPDMDGVIEGRHDVPERTVSYEVQLTTGDPTTGPYETVVQTTNSSWQIAGLISGTRIWVRVRGIGSGGVGPWSDPATKIVP